MALHSYRPVKWLWLGRWPQVGEAVWAGHSGGSIRVYSIHPMAPDEQKKSIKNNTTTQPRGSKPSAAALSLPTYGAAAITISGHNYIGP